MTTKTIWPGAKKGIGVAKLPKTNNRYSATETIVNEDTIKDFNEKDVTLFKDSKLYQRHRMQQEMNATELKMYYNPVMGKTKSLKEWKEEFDDFGASGFKKFADFKSEILEGV